MEACPLGLDQQHLLLPSPREHWLQRKWSRRTTQCTWLVCRPNLGCGQRLRRCAWSATQPWRLIRRYFQLLRWLERSPWRPWVTLRNWKDVKDNAFHEDSMLPINAYYFFVLTCSSKRFCDDKSTDSNLTSSRLCKKASLKQWQINRGLWKKPSSLVSYFVYIYP